MPGASVQRRQGLVVFGEFFLDLVFYNLPRMPRMGEEVKTQECARFPGGGLATTALVAAALGTPTKAITRVGSDAISTSEWRALTRGGVSTKGCDVAPSLPTAISVCAAFDGDRMMITHDAINKDLEKLFLKQSAQRQIESSKHLHLACALHPPQKWIPLLRRARLVGLGISADIGWNPEVFQSAKLRALLSQTDFLFPNESEAKAISGKKTVEAAAREIARWVRTPIIKLGADGCLAFSGGKLLRINSIAVRAVDATGSGDAFNGGFLHGLLSGWALEDCLRAGNVCGALAATRPGGSSAIPTRRKLAEFMKKI
jgi:sugar/nucleoside kinase (ribokinase family)